MLEKLLPEHVLFIDIETVPQYENLASVPENMQKLWTKKAVQIGKEGESADDLYARAGIYSEFGKIVCISAGKIFRKGKERAYRVKSYCGDDEKTILQEFSAMLTAFMANPSHRICAHNGQELDFAFTSIIRHLSYCVPFSVFQLPKTILTEVRWQVFIIKNLTYKELHAIAKRIPWQLPNCFSGLRVNL